MSEIQPLLDLLGAKHGWVAAAVAWIGALRLALKPFGAGVARFVAAAVEFCRVAGPGEVSWMDRVMHSVPYRMLAFLVDYVASVKLPLRAGDARPPTVPPVALMAILGALLWCAVASPPAVPPIGSTEFWRDPRVQPQAGDEVADVSVHPTVTYRVVSRYWGLVTWEELGRPGRHVMDLNEWRAWTQGIWPAGPFYPVRPAYPKQEVE
jgi:hypothetical protein